MNRKWVYLLVSLALLAACRASSQQMSVDSPDRESRTRGDLVILVEQPDRNMRVTDPLGRVDSPLESLALIPHCTRLVLHTRLQITGILIRDAESGVYTLASADSAQDLQTIEVEKSGRAMCRGEWPLRNDVTGEWLPSAPVCKFLFFISTRRDSCALVFLKD